MVKLSIVAALLMASALAAFAQTATPASPAGPQFTLGSGAGFKPYQTPIRSGASAFIEGGMVVAQSAGLYGMARVDMLSTYAQMVVEGCKSLYSSVSTLVLACGGPGFGADANNFGLALAGSGKLFFAPKALRNANAWVGIEMGVEKTTVPAPSTTTATGTTNISPVQPSFRVGIHKFFP